MGPGPAGRVPATERGVMKVIGTDARVRVEWTANITIEPGSVPDRPMKYARTGQFYRPDRLTLQFLAIAVTAAGLPVLAPGNLAEILGETTLSGAFLSGHRIRKDGNPGKDRHEEHFYTHNDGLPAWTQELLDTALAGFAGG
jgi:hypothetical protein